MSVNSFIEDTSVLIAFAFLFVRGELAQRLSVPYWSGLLCGVVGASESIFPDARFPYASHTLACALATVLGGWVAGATSAGITVLAALVLRPGSEIEVTTLQAIVTVLAVGVAPQRRPMPLLQIAASAAIAQALALQVPRFIATDRMSLTSGWTIAANTVGILLIVLVERDALVRARADQDRREAIEARQVAAEAKYAAIRSRVQPHFLFNSLNTIAALCQIDSTRAVRAATKLGELMRHTLEANYAQGHTLAQELDIVQSYLAIEQERFRGKLRVRIDTDGFDDVVLPYMGLQILVENAVLHGISKRKDAGQLSIMARRCGDEVLLAVADDGSGISGGGWRRPGVHGLEVLEAQLLNQNGDRAQIRVVPRPSRGTLAVIRVPWEAEVIA